MLEVEFEDAEAWAVFRQLPAVQAALDAVPDPARGLFVFPGRGGTSGARVRSRPRPQRGAGGAAVPVPSEPEILAGAANAILTRLVDDPVPAMPSTQAA